MNKVFYPKSWASICYISLTCRHPRAETSPPAWIPSLEMTLPTQVFWFLISTKLLCKFARVCYPSNKWAIYSKEAEYQRVHESKFLDVLFEPLSVAFLFRCLELKGSSTNVTQNGGGRFIKILSDWSEPMSIWVWDTTSAIACDEEESQLLLHLKSLRLQHRLSQHKSVWYLIYRHCWTAQQLTPW